MCHLTAVFRSHRRITTGNDVRHDRLFIGGDWVPPSSPPIECATRHVVGAEAAEADVDAAVAAARRAFDDPSVVVVGRPRSVSGSRPN